MAEMLELKAADNDTVITSAIAGGNDEVNKLLRSLSEDERERLRILQRLLATAEQPNYGKRQQAAAERLGITVRSVRRLVRQLREEGVVSVMRRSRSDRGEARISFNNKYIRSSRAVALPLMPIGVDHDETTETLTEANLLLNL